MGSARKVTVRNVERALTVFTEKAVETKAIQIWNQHRTFEPVVYGVEVISNAVVARARRVFSHEKRLCSFDEFRRTLAQCGPHCDEVSIDVP